MIIKTNTLSLNIKGIQILNDVSINIPESSIYAFLGYNGSGKTSFINCLLGLRKFRKGNILYKSKPFSITDFNNIGVVFDVPSLYQNLSAIENLQIFSLYRNIKVKNYTNHLERVGLLTSREKKVKNFSYGMKQRLSIAVALLHDPDLLILDEPLNGLDPKGILDIRNLLFQLNKKHKKTIFLSSHILSEVEQIATHIGIIDNGKIKCEESINNLLNGDKLVKYIINSKQNENALSLLSSYINGHVQTNRSGEIEIIVSSDKKIIDEIALLLKKNNLALLSCKKNNPTLEDSFFFYTKTKKE